MASQTIQDVKAIFAAAKAKLDSLPAKRNQEVQIFLMQCVLSDTVALVVVVATVGFQLYFAREQAEEVSREFLQNRRLTEAYVKENQRLQKELDSRKP